MRLKSFVVGIGLVFVESFTLIFLLGADSWLFIPLIIAGYGISGAVLGFIWPEGGWRLGLWLVAFWFIMMLLAIPFSDPSPVTWNTKQVVKDLLANVQIVIAACLGAEIGAIIKRRSMALPSSEG